MAIFDPANDAVILRECSDGEMPAHFELRIRVDFNTGLLSATDLDRAPAEAGEFSVVLNGQVVSHGILFRKCPTDAEALKG